MEILIAHGLDGSSGTPRGIADVKLGHHAAGRRQTPLQHVHLSDR